MGRVCPKCDSIHSLRRKKTRNNRLIGAEIARNRICFALYNQIKEGVCAIKYLICLVGNGNDRTGLLEIPPVKIWPCQTRNVMTDI